jgi:hypothetical protein
MVRQVVASRRNHAGSVSPSKDTAHCWRSLGVSRLADTAVDHTRTTPPRISSTTYPRGPSIRSGRVSFHGTQSQGTAEPALHARGGSEGSVGTCVGHRIHTWSGLLAASPAMRIDVQSQAWQVPTRSSAVSSRLHQASADGFNDGPVWHDGSDAAALLAAWWHVEPLDFTGGGPSAYSTRRLGSAARGTGLPAPGHQRRGTTL